MMEKTNNNKISSKRKGPAEVYIDIHERYNLPPYFYLLLNNEDSNFALEAMERMGMVVNHELRLSLEKEKNPAITKRLFVYNERVIEDTPDSRLLVPEERYPNPLDIKRFSLSSLYKQFMEDGRIDPDKIAVKPLKNYLLQCIPHEMLTEHLCYDAVLTDASYIKNVPPKLMSKRIFAAALKVNGSYIKMIPPDKLKDIHYLMAVKSESTSLQYCPEELKDNIVCSYAVSRKGETLEYVPDSVKTKEMCRMAFSNFFSTSDLIKKAQLLQYVPFPDVALEEFKKVVKAGAPPILAFRSINKEIVDERLVEEGLKHTGEIFNFLPAEFQTEENALKAVAKSGIQHVDLKFWNDETITTHIVYAHDPVVLKFVNEFVPLTPEHYLLLYTNAPGFLKPLERIQDIRNSTLFHYDEHMTVPDSVMNEPNIFSLTLKVKKEFGVELLIPDAKRLINGDPIPFTKQRPGSKYPLEGLIEFDKEKGVLRTKETRVNKNNYESKTQERKNKKIKI